MQLVLRPTVASCSCSGWHLLPHLCRAASARMQLQAATWRVWGCPPTDGGEWPPAAAP
eukprot:CAMPEP_0168505090 /NCGR_PEP_ID=MMETSP0228-20121227/76696_1 /TAXON_ID=133427 /ORGANISM="Protoceratium reticulatum, Strain CCCM 535 (=CCMP 1889)" /LENGTH=57 /DNA_ID=CAMNT_0008522175 /DNA_START=84 /DNA_END=253 /DNA_ORIENTATION=+